MVTKSKRAVAPPPPELGFQAPPWWTMPPPLGVGCSGTPASRQALAPPPSWWNMASPPPAPPPTPSAGVAYSGVPPSNQGMAPPPGWWTTPPSSTTSPAAAYGAWWGGQQPPVGLGKLDESMMDGSSSDVLDCNMDGRPAGGFLSYFQNDHASFPAPISDSVNKCADAPGSKAKPSINIEDEDGGNVRTEKRLTWTHDEDKRPVSAWLHNSVASHDLRICHAFFGVAGSNNDINVLDQSHLFMEAIKGEAPRVNFSLNGREYNTGYYLADGIYPEWAAFVKTIAAPRLEKHKMFAKQQEGARKDVERAFGVLQARWNIVRRPARLWSRKTIGNIMQDCLILHNMIVGDEGEMAECSIDLNDSPGTSVVLPRSEERHL